MLTFEKCVTECLTNLEFVKEFDRLMGTSLGGKPRSPLIAAIDKATGFDELKLREDYELFIAFVYEVMWERLPAGAKDPRQLVEPPQGKTIKELLAAREQTQV
jgi:hypothetical protein